jgi:hypothetical protein
MEYAMASTSMAHTYGNVTAFITEFIKQLFPKNYFKTVHISSTVAYRQFNIFQNTKQEFLKKNKPMLIIRPRIEVSENDNFLFGTLLTQRITDQYLDLDFTNLQDFFSDEDKGIHIKYLLNRLKMFFDVTVIVESNMEQINQFINLKNRVRQEHPFFIQTALESFIPKELFGILSKDSGVPLYTENTGVKDFLDYANSKANSPITYKLKNSSGLDEFFRYYPVNIDTMFTGLNIDDGNKKNFVSDTFAINWTVSTEFNAGGLYYYFTETPNIITDIDMSIKAENTIIPIFTVSNLFDAQLPAGWNLYSSSMYKVEDDNSPDITNIRDLFNQSLISAIKYHINNSIPLDVLIKTIVIKDNIPLEYDTEYTIDYNTFDLMTKKVNTASTYRVINHINIFYLNNLLKDIFNFEEEK